MKPKTIKLTGAAILIASLVGVFLVLNRPESNAAQQSTNDAYIKADMTIVAPQVSGRIVDVAVEDNQVVRRGDLLATIDNREFTLAVQSARAQVDAAAAGVRGLETSLVLQQSIIQQARATLQADQAELALARQDLVRYRNLAREGAGTIQARQQAQAKLLVRQAARDKSSAAYQGAQQKADVLQAELDNARARHDQAQAALGQAELQLSYTRILAPIDGTVGQRSVRVGGYVNTGKPILTLVPLDALYIEANYRETQLARVRPGQAVTVTVDALPGQAFTGRVDSLGPASGVSYAAIAPHNATGNFTKIVQRLPVRIVLDAGQPGLSDLRVGMSVQPEIQVEQG